MNTMQWIAQPREGMLPSTCLGMLECRSGSLWANLIGHDFTVLYLTAEVLSFDATERMNSAKFIHISDMVSA